MASKKNYAAEFRTNRGFAVKEVKNALDIYELQQRLKHSIEKTCEKNGALIDDASSSLMAWDLIIPVLKKIDHQINEEMVWKGIYDGWVDWYSPDDEKEFLEWFNYKLSIARAKMVLVC